MTSLQRVNLVVDALNAAGVRYMLTGSLASNLYGIPRSTQDADFVVHLGDGSIGDIAERLSPIFKLDPQVSFETVTATTRYVFHAADHELKVELFLLSQDSHDQERFRRRRQDTFEGRLVHVPTAEDVIITKLRWSKQGKRAKDLEDARNVMAVQLDRLDWPYVERWCTEHETLDLLERLRSEIPPL